MIELEILPSGEIRFRRQDGSSNESLLELLSEFVDVEEIKEFLDGGKKIEVLFGNESFCG